MKCTKYQLECQIKVLVRLEDLQLQTLGDRPHLWV